MKSNKSQSLPINAVIIAVIALVVLVVVITIFSVNVGKTSQNIGSCITKNGKCADDTELKGNCGGNYPIPLFVSGDCQNTNPKNLCCIKVGVDEIQNKK